MRKYVLIWGMTMCLGTVLEAQELKMEPVNSPIFTLWGTDPTTVDRPSTPKALTTSLLSNLTSGSLPQNYSMEVAPFWLKPRYKLEFNKDDGKIWDNMKQTFAASVATNHTTDTNGLSHAGIGFRVQLLRGHANTKVYNDLLAYQDSMQQALDNADDTKFDAYSAKSTALAQTLAQRRMGSIVQVSGALSTDFADNQFTNGKVESFAIWPTYTYRTTYLDFIGMARLIGYNVDGSIETATDFGGKLAFSYERLTVSAEYAHRLQGNIGATIDETNRYSILVEYKVTDNAYLQYAIGKNFVSPFTPQTNLITLLGFNVGIGTTPQLTGVGS